MHIHFLSRHLKLLVTKHPLTGCRKKKMRTELKIIMKEKIRKVKMKDVKSVLGILGQSLFTYHGSK